MSYRVDRKAAEINLNGIFSLRRRGGFARLFANRQSKTRRVAFVQHHLYRCSQLTFGCKLAVPINRLFWTSPACHAMFFRYRAPLALGCMYAVNAGTRTSAQPFAVHNNNQERPRAGRQSFTISTRVRITTEAKREVGNCLSLAQLSIDNITILHLGIVAGSRWVQEPARIR